MTSESGRSACWRRLVQTAVCMRRAGGGVIVWAPLTLKCGADSSVNEPRAPLSLSCVGSSVKIRFTSSRGSPPHLATPRPLSLLPVQLEHFLSLGSSIILYLSLRPNNYFIFFLSWRPLTFSSLRDWWRWVKDEYEYKVALLLSKVDYSSGRVTKQEWTAETYFNPLYSFARP